MRSVLLILALGATGCGATTRDVTVVRYDVELTLFADGSMGVVESISAQSLNPQSTFVRTVAGTHIDGIADVKSTLDGAAGGETHINRSGGMRAVWSLAGPPASHLMKLEYRVGGAMAAQETRGLLRWKLLPASRSYPVVGSRINIRVADGGSFVAGPALNDGRVQFVVQGSRATAELADIQPEQDVLVSADVEFGSGGMIEPAWQTNGTRAWRLMPAFLSAGVCLIGIALGIVAMMRLQYAPASRKSQVGAKDSEWTGVLRGLRISGVVAVVAAVIGAVVIDQTLARFGVWPMAVPIGVLGMGVIFLWTSVRWRRKTTQ